MNTTDTPTPTEIKIMRILEDKNLLMRYYNYILEQTIDGKRITSILTGSEWYEQIYKKQN